jgi:hypothetical protein
MTSRLEITLEARRYALAELCRRAGLDENSRKIWAIETSADGQTLTLRARDPHSGRIEFPVHPGELRPELTVRKPWPISAPSHLAAVVPDFVVPFARRESMAGEPLFVEVSLGCFRCTEDLLATIVLVLSRYEELAVTRRDAHGRFEAASSMAVRDGYLDRPIVDEYGLALESVICALIPGWKPRPRRLRVKLSHDVDEIGIPFSPKLVAVQFVARRSFMSGLRDLAAGVAPVMPGSLRQVIELCTLAEKHGLHSALYWKASGHSAYDSGYSLADPRVAKVIAWAREQNLEMGVHPGYDTLLAPEKLGEEVALCRRALQQQVIGGRQHYLRWSPETWLHWEQCGLAYDSTVGYADRVGFRAGTCVPYFPWLWTENRRAALLEIPLIMMDRTITSSSYMGLTPDESLSTLKTLMHRCQAVGGVVALLWHNNCLGHPFTAYYSRIFAELAGTENYDWRSDMEVQRRVGAAE